MSIANSRRAASICALAMFLASPLLRSQAFPFGPVQQIPISTLNSPLVIPLDMNGDGNTDLYVPGYASGNTTNSIYLGNGKGGFSATPVRAVETEIGGLQAYPVFYDVNGDGFADEVYAYGGFDDPGGMYSYNGVF